MAGPIVISVLGDTRDLVRSLGDGESRMDRFGRVASGLGRAAAVGLAAGGAAVVAFGVASVKSASDAQQSLGATETVFGKFADQVVANSDRAAKAVGLSSNDYRESANLIGSLFKNQGVAADQLAGKTDAMVKAGADLAATFGGPTSAAVEALGSAFKGEFDPLEKYGISIKQSTINAELAARGQDKLTGAALKAAQQAVTSDLIMRQSKDSLGAFGRESDTLAHQQQVLGAQFENIKAKVGSALLPVLTQAGMFLNDTMFPALEKLGPPAQALAAAVGDRLGAAFTTLQPLLQSASTTFQSSILPAIQGLGGYVAGTFGPVLGTLVGIIGGQVLPTVIRFGTFIYGTLYPAVVQIVTAVAQNLAPVFTALAQTFQTQVLPALSVLLAKFEEARPTIQAIIMVALKVTGVVLEFAAAVLGKVLPPLIRLAGFLIGTLFQAIGVAIGAVVGIVTAVVNFGKAVGDAVGAVGRLGNKVTETITGLPAKVLGALGDTGSLLFEKGKALIQGLIDGILSKIKDVGNAMGSVASKVKGFLPGSPVKEGPLTSWNNGAAGKRLIDLLALGLEDTTPVANAMTRVASTVADPLAMPDALRPALALADTGLARGAGAGGTTVQITVEVPVGASMVDAGRAIAEALDDYYRAGGRRP